MARAPYRLALGELFGDPVDRTVWRIGLGMRGHEHGYRAQPGSDAVPDGWVTNEGIFGAEFGAQGSWAQHVWPQLESEGVSRADYLPFETDEED